MNGNRLARTLLPLVAGILLWPAHARSTEFPYVFTDPLGTVPAGIVHGVKLPGDAKPFPASYTKDFSQPVSLAEAVDLAMSNNPRIKVAWADIKIQSGALGEAYAAYLPVVNGAFNWTWDSIQYSGSRSGSTDTNRYTLQASAVWRLFDFGGRAANRESNEKLLAAALSSYDAVLQEALTRVIQSYFEAMTADAAHQAKIKIEDVARSILLSAKDREEKGVASRSDTLRATTALARATLDKNRAKGDLQKALALLKFYLGVPGETELILPPELNEKQDSLAESKKLSLWLSEAENHPLIIAAQKQLEAAQRQVTVAKSAGLPSINLSGNYYQNTRPGEAVTPGTQEFTFIAGISIPLFDGFASTYKVRGSQARVEKQAATLADTRQQISLGVVRAYADATAALQNLGASTVLLESAQSALAVSQRKYDKGATDVTEILSTQAALADAWNERVRCLDEWHSARLQLLASTGKMGRFAVSTVER